jgi:hypothetical protein
MQVMAMVLIIFFTGGQVASKVAVGPEITLDECKVQALAVEATWLGKSIKLTEDGDALIVLDAQAFCIPATRQDHA